jgi:hypothetical protein
MLYPPYSRVYVSVSCGFPPGIRFLDHRPSSGIGWIPTCLIDHQQEPGRGSPVPICCLSCCFRWVLSTVRVFGRIRPTKMCLIFSFERKELKGSRNYHLVKPLSPSKLVHPYDGSVIPSIHSPVGEHFIMTARFRLLPLRTGDFLVSHPASWIEVQSLPRGCCFLTPTRQGRNCTFHQQISYQRLLPVSHPPAFMRFRLNGSHLCAKCYTTH